MFGSRHFQALKNNRWVGRHNDIFIPSPAENQKKKKKWKEVSGDLFRD